MGSADYKDPYRLIGMGIKRAQIETKLVQVWLRTLKNTKTFEPLKNMNLDLNPSKICDSIFEFFI